MKTLNFCFNPSSLKAAVEFLKGTEADTISGKNDEEISALIKQASVSAFERAYKGDVVDPISINSGVIYGGIVWKGLVCLFGCPEICSDEEEPFEVSISEKSSKHVKIITVDYLANLG